MSKGRLALALMPLESLVLLVLQEYIPGAGGIGLLPLDWAWHWVGRRSGHW